MKMTCYDIQSLGFRDEGIAVNWFGPKQLSIK